MTDLIGSPYRPPKTRVGADLVCEIRGQVTVAGLTAAAIPWPYWEPEGYRGGSLGGKRPLIVCGDLVRAIQAESRQAVAQAWGVSESTVKRWRAALGVGRWTEGTRRLWSELAATKLPLAARQAGGRAGGRAKQEHKIASKGKGSPSKDKKRKISKSPQKAQ